MLLYSCSPTTLDSFAKIAPIVIAAFAVLQFSYIVFIHARKEKKRNEKEWFHRLVVEPKINKIYDFFDTTEEQLEKIQELLKNGYSHDKVLPINDEFKKLTFRFRKSFVELIEPIDAHLASQIQEAVDSFLNFLRKNFSVTPFLKKN